LNESAGRTKSTKTRPGDSYLKGALGLAALSASKAKNTYFSAKFRWIASRRGKMKAIVALEHAMLAAAWYMLTTGEIYLDPGADYFTRRAPTKAKARAIGQLEALGYQVTITPANDPARQHSVQAFSSLTTSARLIFVSGMHPLREHYR
jgi:transposase